jgi:GNAT superfamily N-acetyltransferase
VRVAEYGPSRRADVADLTARVWGTRPDEAELAWFYERNPVRPASVLLAEEDDRVVASAAISFQRMSIAGRDEVVGTAVHLATDPAYRGRGIFSDLQVQNEERVRGSGVRLLLVVPNAQSAPILVERLGWRELRPLRVWARPGVLPVVDSGPRAPGGNDRVVRDPDWVRWRFVAAPRRYTVIERGGHAVAARRGRVGNVVAVAGAGLGDAVRAARGAVVIACPPPWERRRYLAAGFVPTTKKFTLLGKSLDGTPLPERPHLELGDLDFF